jgi:endonuclease III
MPESLKNKRKRMGEILSLLKTAYPHSKCSLYHQNPFQLLIATMLSAQCTDERVNKVTPPLFQHYPSPELMATAPIESIIELIRSTGFFNTKSQNIKACSIELMTRFNGDVPSNIEDLVSLPGVGRKTANVVLGTIFKIPGIVVDTHVIRMANLLKFVNGKDAVKIEKELEKVIDKDDWTLFTHLIIDHGRAVCIARRPQCGNCVLSELCPSFHLIPEYEIEPRKTRKRKSS